MKLSKIAIIAIPAAIIIGLIAHKKSGGCCGSRGSCGGPGGVAFEKIKALRQDLNLSLGQKFKIHSVVKGFKDDLKSQFAAGKAARSAVKAATLQHGADSPEAHAAATGLAEVAKNRALLFAKIASEIRPILSDEQVRKFETARLEFEAMIQSRLDNLG